MSTGHTANVITLCADQLESRIYSGSEVIETGSHSTPELPSPQDQTVRWWDAVKCEPLGVVEVGYPTVSLSLGERLPWRSRCGC